MPRRTKKPFYLRGFVSWYVTLSFLIMAVTGIMLYVSPPGRVAHWSNWTLLGLTKTQWQSVHTVFSLLFVIMAAIHLYFNWKPIISYLRTKVQSQIKLRWEFLTAVVVVVFIGSFTLLELPPFQPIMDWGEAISYSWSNEETEPPVPHAELMTIPELAKSMQVSPQDIRESLEAKNIILTDPEATIQDIANQYALTPQQLFAKMELPEESAASPTLEEGSGYGRMSVQEIAAKLNISTNAALDNLQQNGIEASPTSNIREIGLKHNILPYDLVKLIQS